MKKLLPLLFILLAAAVDSNAQCSLVINPFTGKFECGGGSAAPGSGEANTTAALGGGVSTLAGTPKTGSVLQFKTWAFTSPLSGVPTGDLITVSMTPASTSQDGLLTAANFNIFNGKQAALGFTPFSPANNLSEIVNAATARGNLGVSIGVHVQAYSADLTTFAGLATTNGSLPMRNGSNWVLVQVPDCPNPTTQKLNFTLSTRTFGCNTDQDSGSSTALSSGTDIDVAGGLINAGAALARDTEVQRGTLSFCSATGTAGAETCLMTPALQTSYPNGMVVQTVFANNNSTTKTLAIDSLSAINILRYDGTALQANDIVAGRQLPLTYKSSDTTFRLPPMGGDSLPSQSGVPSGSKLTTNGTTASWTADEQMHAMHTNDLDTATVGLVVSSNVGQPRGRRVVFPLPFTISAFDMDLTTAGSAGCKTVMALAKLNSSLLGTIVAGTQVISQGNCDGTTGLKAFTLTTPVTVPAGEYYIVYAATNGGVAYRGISLNTANHGVLANQTAAPLFAHGTTGEFNGTQFTNVTTIQFTATTSSPVNHQISVR